MFADRVRGLDSRLSPVRKNDRDDDVLCCPRMIHRVVLETPSSTATSLVKASAGSRVASNRLCCRLLAHGWVGGGTDCGESGIMEG